MSPEIEAWQEGGSFIPFGPFEHQVFVKELGDAKAPPGKTLLLIHGFPESSFSYHKIVDGMRKIFDRIILFDLLGYGLSDKPIENYAYSLVEQADVVFTVWKHFGVTGGHMLSHDMGDSVATEILARRENGLLPAWFSDDLQTLTFTNGSMVLDLAQLRSTQKLLLSSFGKLLKNVVSYNLFNRQIKGAQGNDKLSERDIELLWEMNTLKEGNKKTYLTIKYLNDRKRFEKTRWLPALKATALPVHICWGDVDNVARVQMAHYLKEEVQPNAQLTIMKGLGHFGQIGSPEIWVQHVGKYYEGKV